MLAFPGIFRGTFDVRASDINEEMKMAAARALAELVSEEELSTEYIIPKAFDPRVGKAVAAAVAQAAALPAWRESKGETDKANKERKTESLNRRRLLRRLFNIYNQH